MADTTPDSVVYVSNAGSKGYVLVMNRRRRSPGVIDKHRAGHRQAVPDQHAAGGDAGSQFL